MTTKSKIITGLVIGLAITGVGYYFYRKIKNEREKKTAEMEKTLTDIKAAQDLLKANTKVTPKPFTPEEIKTLQSIPNFYKPFSTK